MNERVLLRSAPELPNLFVFSLFENRIAILWSCSVPGQRDELHAQVQNLNSLVCQYSRTPLIRINWDGEPSGYAENLDNLIFLENKLHWPSDTPLLLFALCTCV
jgi:hypothetical protein